ncbi:MAG: aldo/keto reductase [Planctomycetes bacterium]|nr:aldo/keto reductase [Planctomycetota bacterium]
MAFAADRYERMRYRRCGRSGLMLPAVSLGGWQAIGGYRDDEHSKRIVYTAFDLGITHFDFANNYGTPAGASEALFGRLIPELPREELVISSKAGYRMWPGPYGEWGSRKYLIESCEASLKRLRVDHVDIFYSHRFDPDTPLEETLGALETLVRQGKALYAGISSYPDPHFSNAVDIVRARSWAPITIHQPYYHLLAREAEREVLPTAERAGVGVIAFCPLAQGLLTDRYLAGIPTDSRAAQEGGSWLRSTLTPDRLDKARRLDVIAKRRGQSLAEMSLAWLLKDPRVTSVLIGASSPEQVRTNVRCLDSPPFSPADLTDIDAACA